jgi:hypothetical protein
MSSQTENMATSRTRAKAVMPMVKIPVSSAGTRTSSVGAILLG